MYQDFFNKDDDYLDKFKQKVAEQKIATMEERRSEIARSRNNFLGTFAGIVLAGVVGWFVLAPQYEQSHKEIPVIQRPHTAVKIKPENPGGMNIPNQDKDVYSIVEKKAVDNTVVENLLPEPEKPKLPDIVPEEDSIADTNANNLDKIVDEVTDSAIQNITDSVAENKLPAKPDDLLAKPNNETDKEKKNTEVTIQPHKTSASLSGSWQIQLIASKNKDAIERTWNTLSAKYTLLKTYTHEIQSDNLGTQGIIYKLRAGNFASKGEAQAACASLKSKGLNDCIAKER